MTGSSTLLRRLSSVRSVGSLVFSTGTARRAFLSLAAPFVAVGGCESQPSALDSARQTELQTAPSLAESSVLLHPVQGDEAGAPTVILVTSKGGGKLIVDDEDSWILESSTSEVFEGVEQQQETQQVFDPQLLMASTEPSAEHAPPVRLVLTLTCTTCNGGPVSYHYSACIDLHSSQTLSEEACLAQNEMSAPPLDVPQEYLPHGGPVRLKAVSRFNEQVASEKHIED